MCSWRAHCDDIIQCPSCEQNTMHVIRVVFNCVFSPIGSQRPLLIRKSEHAALFLCFFFQPIRSIILTFTIFTCLEIYCKMDACFPALGIAVSCFPVLGNGCMFSCACSWLHVLAMGFDWFICLVSVCCDWPDPITLVCQVLRERFSTERRKTRTKLITLASHKRHRQFNKIGPIKTSRYR